MKKLLILIWVSILTIAGICQSDSTDTQEQVKTGWNFAGLPVVGFDADMGFQYGLLGNAFYYGDGSTYPEYRHSIYAEVSRFTKGSGVNQIFYDSKYLLPWNLRITADLSYLTEKAVNFYGFNGYQAAYHPEFEDDNSDDYISRVYYRHERKLLRVLLDFQKPIIGNSFRALLGFNYFHIKTASVDIDNLNKGKSEDKLLPDTALLFDDYVNFGLIGADEKNGGDVFYLKFGLIYDTRDNEPAPNRGIWSEALIITAPGFLGNQHYSFTKLALTHRQYVTLIKELLVFAYRLGYQTTLGGTAPFYIQPYLYSSFSRSTKPEGLGGARTLRGILRNRIVGDGIVHGSTEFRLKFAKATLFKQNFYFAIYGFADGGMVVRDHRADQQLIPYDKVEHDHYWDQENDSFHLSYGLGLRIAMNQNFIVVFDYGFAADRRDGTSGLYIGVGNNF